MIFMQAFKQASSDRATKALSQSEPSSKLPLLTESKGEMALEFRSSFIKPCKYRMGSYVRRLRERHIFSTKECPSILKQECYLAYKSISVCAVFIWWFPGVFSLPEVELWSRNTCTGQKFHCIKSYHLQSFRSPTARGPACTGVKCSRAEVTNAQNLPSVPQNTEDLRRKKCKCNLSHGGKQIYLSMGSKVPEDLYRATLSKRLASTGCAWTVSSSRKD